MDLREVWQSESGDFTPWLARPENIALLGETIGLDLVVLAQEKEVGPFRADILCKDPTSEELILIENQLERTDHTHLGQILTYAAGLKTVTIIWVARRFTEEHRATLDWLNEITNEEFRFFGLEAEVWRIGDSAPAPKFNIVSQPNDWSRQVSNRAGKLSRGELTPSRQLQLEFWTAFSAFVEEGTYRFRTIKPGPQNW
ncbi:MAG: hypothetical protein KC423_29250, partial [Anaerolineales bacterium]|nr:hypothetical protein [Anaerolineales bacterium]